MRDWINLITEALQPAHLRPVVPEIDEIVRCLKLDDRPYQVVGYAKKVTDRTPTGADYWHFNDGQDWPDFYEKCDRDIATAALIVPHGIVHDDIEAIPFDEITKI